MFFGVNDKLTVLLHYKSAIIYKMCTFGVQVVFVAFFSEYIHCMTSVQL